MRNTQFADTCCVFSHLITDESTSMITAPLAMDAIRHQDAHRNEHHNMPNVDPTRFLPVHGTTWTPQVDATSWCNTTRFLMITSYQILEKSALHLCCDQSKQKDSNCASFQQEVTSYPMDTAWIVSPQQTSANMNHYHVNFLRETSTAKKKISNLQKNNNTLIHWKIYNDTKIWATLYWASYFFGKGFWWNQNRNWAPKPVWREMQSA